MPDTEGRDENSSGAGAPPIDHAAESPAVLTGDGWDVYFNPGFCGGTIQPGFVIHWQRRWYRTKHRVNPVHRADVLSKEDAQTIKAALPRLMYGNVSFHAYLRRTRKTWLEIPFFDVAALKQAADVAAEEQDKPSSVCTSSPALQAEVERLREGLETINRLTYPGNRTLDEMMRDMGLACDIARSLLKRSTEV